MLNWKGKEQDSMVIGRSMETKGNHKKIRKGVSCYVYVRRVSNLYYCAFQAQAN
jgi:hypothetical protein